MARLGWRCFDERPDDDQTILVYAEDDKNGFWVYTCIWRNGALNEIGLSPIEECGAVALCWRPTSLPGASMIKKSRDVTPPDLALSEPAKWVLANRASQKAWEETESQKAADAAWQKVMDS